MTDIETSRESTAENNSTDLQALFRQHFESTFEPLPASFSQPSIVHDFDVKAADLDLESDWDGFSDHGVEHAETVHFATSTPSIMDVSKDELKMFMVRAQVVLRHQYLADIYHGRVQSLHPLLLF